MHHDTVELHPTPAAAVVILFATKLDASMSRERAYVWARRDVWTYAAPMAVTLISPETDISREYEGVENESPRCSH